MYQAKTELPDITNQTGAASAQHLKWVGMEQIGLPINLAVADSKTVSASALVDIFVSLDTSAKGIHMSRLYLNLNHLLANQTVTPDSLNGLLDAVLTSHQGISQGAMVKLSFDLPLKKKALLSDNFGYQNYQVTITHQLYADKSETSMELTIPYSSTCPCSASLANQLNAQAIDEHFAQETVSKEELLEWLTSSKAGLATPHNQRSYAYIKLSLAHGFWRNLDDLIFDVEKAIGTPVQTAVKREDEQEFAKLNGSNLMFCEDAARRLKSYLEGIEEVKDYWFKVEHQESLHAHNAVVIDYK